MTTRRIPATYSILESRDDAYWKTLCANQNNREELATPAMGDSFRAWRRLSCLGEHKEEIPQDVGSLLKSSAQFSQAHVYAIWPRLLFVTD
jgi:hypothetical protein